MVKTFDISNSELIQFEISKVYDMCIIGLRKSELKQRLNFYNIFVKKLNTLEPRHSLQTL